MYKTTYQLKWKVKNMGKFALFFLVLGLLVLFMGAYGVAGIPLEVAKILLVVFFVFSLITFLGGMTSGNKL